MSKRVVCRESSHAWSWYTSSGPQLNAQLEGWLSQVQSTKRPAKAIIAPHAGDTRTVGLVLPMLTNKWIHLLPREFSSLGLPIMCSCLHVHSPVWIYIYRTLLYNLHIDQKIYGELWKTGMFERVSLQTDEDEHSIEMHLPYTAKAMESHEDEFTIIPVLVGALSESKRTGIRKTLQ